MYEKNQCVPNTILQKLQCSLCNGYLSCSPLRALPNGSTQCGRCVNNSASSIRVLALEAILNKFSFPCIFNDRGCKEFVMFDKAMEHESKCAYRSFHCPLPSKNCPWKGSSALILSHCQENHYDFIKKKSAFKLEIDHNSQGLFVCIKDNVAFIVKYIYDGLGRILRYDVRYCRTETLRDVCVKLQLLNDLEQDCSINLKANKCSCFNESFCDEKSCHVLNLNNYLENLENPKTVIVTLSMSQMGTEISACSELNYNLLNSLKCGDCCNYLIPPLYDLDEHVICSECGKRNPRCILSNNDEIKRQVADVHYPCRWRECKSIIKSNQFKLHELNCTFRHYDCFFPTCRVTFMLEAAIDHLQTHRAVYMPEEIVYKIEFRHLYNFKHLFTIKNNGVLIVAQHNIIKSGDVHIHRVALFSSNPNEIMGNLEFEHKHCKIKSKLFLLVSDHNTDISLNELPKCYKEDQELTISVSILDNDSVPKLADVAVPKLN